jgi:GrpB-like predicted nucleotidyltransferase (UPF0157 family)
LAPYDPGWARKYQTEAERIQRALGDNIVAVHHIGSTAIPGIYAKPIIDILVEVENILRVDSQAWAMEELGYEVMGEFGIPGRRYFRKCNGAGVRTHHVHAFQVGSHEIERHLAFRDYMIAHSEEAQAYSALKRKLAEAHSEDRQAYIDGKDEFVKEHEANALRWLSSDESRRASG